MVKILITDPIHEDGVKALRDFAEVEVAIGLNPAELIKMVKWHDVLVVRSATKVTEEIIDAGDRLKVIARAGAGIDNIDVEAAKARGVEVLNTPEAPAVSVAELVFGHMLLFSRHVSRADMSMKAGLWEKARFMGTELRGKILGIIGTGRIGQAVGYIAKAFSMNLLAHDVAQNAEFAKRTGAEYVDLDNLLQRSDFVTLHVPLTPQTRHLIGKRELELMKPTAVLINTSRGKIIDEGALIEVLRRGGIAGACLDVYEKEPPKDSPLFKLPNVVLTPHIGASTLEAQREAAVIIAEKIREALARTERS